MIRTIFAGSVGAAMLVMAGAPSAQAQSMARAPVFTWTGFYIGATAGYMKQDSKSQAIGSDTFDSSGLNAAVLYSTGVANAIDGPLAKPTDATVGGLIGYNYQIGQFVVGAEADAQTMVTKGSTSERGALTPITGFPDVVQTTVTSKSKYDYFGTVRGRIGYLLMDNLLVYATGGFAYGDINQLVSVLNNVNVRPPQTFVISGFGTTFRSSSTPTGYTVGGGLEYALDASWSVKAEALYYDLGKTASATQFSSFSSFTTPPTRFTGNGVAAVSENSGYVARIGLNYKFNLF